jgi:(R)-2-hydroxyacyl-CoA dehydratese activating ATPase
MIVAGIDVGSTTTKAVILSCEKGTEENRKILGKSFIQTGFNHEKASSEAYLMALENGEVSRDDIDFVVGTGYGRNNIPFANKKVTEIACHGTGAFYYFPTGRTIIDIGGQDSKVIKLNPKGRVVDFAMNEKCAAGTGRFIEVMANVLQVELEEMGKLSQFSEEDISITSMCTVFAESEIISKISQGFKREDIINALHKSVTERVLPLGKRMGIENDIIMTGGVARNQGVISAFEKKLETQINVPDDPQTIGALGAAIQAANEIK